MQEIKRILERRFKGESQRSIASSLHLSRNTVSKVFKAADQTGLSWVQFQTMDDRWYYVKISDNLNYRICNKRCFILVSLC